MTIEQIQRTRQTAPLIFKVRQGMHSVWCSECFERQHDQEHRCQYYSEGPQGRMYLVSSSGLHVSADRWP